MQKVAYRNGTSDHLEHNENPDYWNYLLGPVTSKPEAWTNKTSLDIGCGKGRNIRNLLSISNWSFCDGIDLSGRNISHCRSAFSDVSSRFFTASGTDLHPIPDAAYDFVMSTITLQHIPVYEIRDGILRDSLRVLKPGEHFQYRWATARHCLILWGVG